MQSPDTPQGFAVLVEALSILFAWPLPSVDAIVHSSTGDDYRLQADPYAQTWTVTIDQDNYTTFSPAQGLINVVNGGVEHTEPAASYFRGRRPGSVSHRAWFAFPSNLSIWGRHGDDWKIIDATKDPLAEQITLVLQSLDDEWKDRVGGRVVIDTNRRIVTGLYVHALDGDVVRYEELTQIRMPFRQAITPSEPA